MSSHKKIAAKIKWLLAVSTMLLAVLLIWQCADIFRVGMSAANQGANGVRISDIYSREIVAERFGRIRWSVWIWLILLMVSLFLNSKERINEDKKHRECCTLIKNAPLKKKEAQAQNGAISSESQKKRQNAIRIIGFVVAVLLIVAGITNGGMFDVFVKAVNICTECIGLG